MNKLRKGFSIPVALVSIAILGLTAFFGVYWYKVLTQPSDTENNEVEVLDASQQADTAPQPPEDIPTTDRPEVDLFVMSFCPYGNLAEETMYPVYELLKNDADINIHYVVNVQGDSISSLRGQPEVDQNSREVCVSEIYGTDSMWEFMTAVNDTCGSDGACWETEANSLGISSADISNCVDNRGFDLMALEAQKTSEFGANASPTLFVNGVKDNTNVYKYGEPEAYKNMICSAFNEPPAVCDTVLENTTSANPGSC
jgi:hypothetical protein